MRSVHHVSSNISDHSSLRSLPRPTNLAVGCHHCRTSREPPSLSRVGDMPVTGHTGAAFTRNIHVVATIRISGYERQPSHPTVIQVDLPSPKKIIGAFWHIVQESPVSPNRDFVETGHDDGLIAVLTARSVANRSIVNILIGIEVHGLRPR